MGLSNEKREIRRMEQAIKTTFIVDTFKIFMDAYQRYLEDGLAEKIVEVALERIASYGEFMDILFEGVRFVEAYDYFRLENEIVLRNRGFEKISVNLI